MEIDGNGQAKILGYKEIHRLFSHGLLTPRDRALFGACLYTACWVSEALQLKTGDVKGDTLTLRKVITKGKDTRYIDILPRLQTILGEYLQELEEAEYLFPALRQRSGDGYLDRTTADKILKDACRRVMTQGVSTHSFRRTALTQMSSAGVPIRTIQEISGHRDLSSLQRCLKATPEQKKGAITALSF